MDKVLVKTSNRRLLAMRQMLVIMIAAIFMVAASPIAQVAHAGPLPASFADLVQKIGPAVVNINVVKQVKALGFHAIPGQRGNNNPFGDFFGKFFGQNGAPQNFKEKGMGSGFIIDSKGYVITNNHVVEDAVQIEVKLADQKTYQAEVMGTDPKTDVALLKLKGDGPFPALALGNSDKVRVGDWVVAVGNPFGLENTVTSGIISAKQRNIGAGPYDNFLQTDASINPGNSGGPLIDEQGEVIGINTAITATGQGIGFAIPSNLAKNVVMQLEKNGKVERGWLGVMIQPITPDLQKSFNLKDDAGALVADVPDNGPAHDAGIKRGDVIVKFDGQIVKDSKSLPAMVAATPIGKKVDVIVLRNGHEKTLEVTIGRLADEGGSVVASNNPAEDKLGMTVQSLTPDIAKQLGVKNDKGVVITDVQQGSPAAEAGLRQGDVIKEIQREPVKNMSDYNRLASKVESKKGGALMLVERSGHTFYTTLDLA
jgi:serine protease Do